MLGKKDTSLGNDYTGGLTPLAIRRLSKERNQLNKEVGELAQQGMYFVFDEEQSNKATALIVGPDETPYAGGFYLFEFTFPNTYPLMPPHVKFLTGDGRVRFNPNLYVNGKVCLSILGTWQGPSWTAACTFRSTLFSIQSLLHARPIQNEPGHETEAGKDCELYSTMLRYENVAVSVMQLQLGGMPTKVRSLRATMAEVFIRRFNEYVKVLNAYDSKEGQQDKSPLFGFSTRYCPSEVRKKLTSLKASLLEDSELRDALAKVAASSTEATSSGTDARRPAEEPESEPDAKKRRVAD